VLVVPALGSAEQDNVLSEPEQKSICHHAHFRLCRYLAFVG